MTGIASQRPLGIGGILSRSPPERLAHGHGEGGEKQDRRDPDERDGRHAPHRRELIDERISELQIPPHFTNIQHALQLARRIAGVQDTPNRQVILITDGLPTAHFEGEHLYLLYPPDPRTEEA